MDKEISIAGKKIFYRTAGSGHPVILIHGFGETGSVWKNQVLFLQDRFRLIIPDLPGSGQSESIDDMSMEGMAEMIREIAATEDTPLFTLIGHSMGGYIALAYAEKYAASLNAWGLFHSTAYADTEEKKATRQKGISFIQQHGAFEFLKNSVPNLFSPQTRSIHPQLVSDFVRELNNFSPESLVSYYEAMMKRPDRTAVLKETTVPVLFVIGKHDTAIPPEDSLKQCHLPEKSYIHVLRKSGHMGMLEESPRSNELLEQFLREIWFV